MNLLRFWKKIRESIAEQPSKKKKQVLIPEVVGVLPGYQNTSAFGLRATAAELEVHPG